MLRTRLREERFQELCKRRGQTEARIAIFKNVFLGAPLLAKGYENQARQVAWAALAHTDLSEELAVVRTKGAGYGAFEASWPTARLPRLRPRAPFSPTFAATHSTWMRPAWSR